MTRNKKKWVYIALFISILSFSVALYKLTNEREEILIRNGHVIITNPKIENRILSVIAEELVKSYLDFNLERVLKLPLPKISPEIEVNQRILHEIEEKLKLLIRIRGGEKRRNFKNDLLLAIVNRSMNLKVESVKPLDLSQNIHDGNIEFLLAKTIRSMVDTFDQYQAVDIPNNIVDVASKVNYILEQSEGLQGRTFKSQMVYQLVSLGEKGIEPLFAELDLIGRNGESWAKRGIIIEALGILLKEKHKSIILKYFKDEQLFGQIVKRYKFPEAEKIALELIISGKYPIESEVFDIALMFNLNDGLKVLKEYARNNRQGAYATLKLATIPDIDITDELIISAERPWGFGNYIPIAENMLERGMINGFDVCLKVLQSCRNDRDLNYELAIEDLVRFYLNKRVDREKLYGWLKQEIDNISYDPTQKKFLIIN